MREQAYFQVELSDWLPASARGQEFNKNLTISLSPGEHLVIVGTSGCGKSTLLNRIADVALHANNPNGGLSAGLLLQEGALLEHLNVRQNLELIARQHCNASAALTVLNNTLKALNLAPELLERKVAELSGGQMRRVAIARALILQPKVLLYDEPDAGLDVANLFSLAKLVNTLLGPSTPNEVTNADSTMSVALAVEGDVGVDASSDASVHTGAASREHESHAAITVSHNPIYIARTATRVMQLDNGQLSTLFDWPSVAANQAQAEQRQALLIDCLASLQAKTPAGSETGSQLKTTKKPQRFAAAIAFCKPVQLTRFFSSVVSVVRGLAQPTRSFSDSLKVFAFGLALSFFSGAVFFGLVGLMLGATTLAVVKLLTDTAIAGWVEWFVSPNDILQMMGGRYALYLGPAVGTMLYAARSGSLVANWLGELIRSRQLDALRYLQVPVNAYVITPMLVATICGAALNIAWFTLSVWWGGVLAADEFFTLTDAASRLYVTADNIRVSQVVLKTGLYSILSSLLIISFAVMPKRSSSEVNRDTTNAIVFSTILVALLELVIILK